MHNSLSSIDPFADWAKKLTVMASNNDLSSREVESYTEKMVEQASKDELTVVIKHLLNHIRMHNSKDLYQYVAPFMKIGGRRFFC